MMATQLKNVQPEGQGIHVTSHVKNFSTQRSRNIVVMPLEYLQSNGEGHCNKAIEELTSQMSMTL